MKNQKEQWSDKKIKRRTFFSFLGFALANIGAWFSWKWYHNLPKTNNKLDEITRNVLSLNEKVKDKFFSNTHLAKT